MQRPFQGTRTRALVFLTLAFLTAHAAALRAQTDVQPGRIAGTVLDGKTGKPLAYVNVMVEGTDLGAMSLSDGAFLIKDVPPGTYTVRASMMGYQDEVRTGVEVLPLRTATVGFSLKDRIVAEFEVDVRGLPPVVDLKSSATERNVTAEETKVRSFDTVDDWLVTQPSVLIQGGEVHVRGARANEMKTLVDGISVTDPLNGESSMDVSLASLADVKLISGGFDAEYGNAQAAVVELKTKEGSSRFSGLVKYMTDDFGAPDKTYFNFDNVLLGLGGPTPVRGLTFYTSGEGVFTDTYLRTSENRARRRFLGLEFRERQNSAFRGQAKLTFNFDGNRKLLAEVLGSAEDFDRYNHRYSREGYWSPTAGPEGGGMWWFEPLDSTFTYYNGAEHTANTLNDQLHGRVRFNQTLGDHTFYSAVLGVHTIHRTVSVKGKAPTEYENTTGSQDDLDSANLFYYIHGDQPVWLEENVRTWTLKADVTTERVKGHRIKSGLEADYYDISNDNRAYPGPEFPLGQFPDRYRVTPWGVSFYAQDRVRYQGMVVNAGLRLDAFDPSKKAYERGNRRRQDLGFEPYPDDLFHRAMYQFSPRLGMAYPITDRDVLHFHYGRFQEVPPFSDLYQHTGGDRQIDPGTTVGNPFLDATTSVSYQVGVEHQFWGRSSINLTFFYKDIFGLIGTDQEEAAILDPRKQPGVSYLNRDYGTAQGLEFSVRKHVTATSRWAGGLSYTYSQARGSSSSETQGFNVLTGGQDRVPITELPLDWDVPHIVSGNLYFSEPNNWGLNIEASYASGAPYTPMGIYDKEVQAVRINTGRLPSTFSIGFKGDKRYKIYRQEFSFVLEGHNVTDRRNLYALQPAGANRYYNVYYTEEGQLGGAYNLRDVRQDLQDDVLVPLHDPRVHSEPRSFRVGIQFDW
jgi:outer membrane receptor protein involved in Fe transport